MGLSAASTACWFKIGEAEVDEISDNTLFSGIRIMNDTCPERQVFFAPPKFDSNCEQCLHPHSFGAR